MNIQNYFKKIIFPAVFLSIFIGTLTAQPLNLPEPRQEKLLNGLKVNVWSDPKAEKVTVKLRIHSGSCFDPKDKTGVMSLLSDIFFPDPQTKNFFEEDLEGSLETTSNYDFLQISAVGKNEEFLTVLETLATAVTNPQITQENFVIVRDAKMQMLAENLKNPEIIGNFAASKKLYGEFPYGRPMHGTPESLKLIDRFDLIFARDRFLTADNATLVVSGNVNFNQTVKAAKRFFGFWKKSEKLVPATFRQPDLPDGKILNIELENTENNYQIKVRNAVGRSHPDYYATEILSRLHGKTYCRKKTRYEAFLLRGVFVSTFNSGNQEQNSCEADVDQNGKPIFREFKQAEFDAEKTALLNSLQKKGVLDWLLDVDTYKLGTLKEDWQKFSNVTLADVNRLEKQLLNEPFAEVSITKKAGEKTN